MDHILWCTGHDLILSDIVKGEGCFLYNSQGRQYLDLESGVWCTPLGHNHPQVNQALKNQIGRITHTGFCYTQPAVDTTAQVILNLLDFTDGKCIFLSSGIVGFQIIHFFTTTRQLSSGDIRKRIIRVNQHAD